MSSSPSILVIDDEPVAHKALTPLLESEFSIQPAYSGPEGLEKVNLMVPDLILLDLSMPEMSGLTVLKKLRENDKNIPVIILTAYGNVDSAVQAIKLGAADYIEKPFADGKLKEAVRAILKGKQNIEELSSQLGIVGKSPQIQKVWQLVEKYGPTDLPILLRGETGTGKEVVARAIHFNGVLKGGPFIAIDCASLPQDLLESELFGHEKGAFTGAVAQKMGKFELAGKGTLFLDEIGNLTGATQVKLLRFLQERKIERVGGTEPIELDVRIIAATNLDLEKAVQEGSFREDLYYRLNVVAVPLPPLRERRDDIPLLVEHFIQKYKLESKGKVKYVPPETMDFLMRYEWPGNVRELENVIERAIVIGKNNAILVEDLPSRIQKGASGLEPEISPEKIPFEQRVENFEKKLIIDALERANWIQTEAAELLDTSRSIIKYKVKKYGIKRGEGRREENE